MRWFPVFLSFLHFLLGSSLCLGCEGHEAPDGLPPGAQYQVGTNDPELDLPLAFTATLEGMDVLIVRGGQGALMLVAAARTNVFVDDQLLTVSARIEDEETAEVYSTLTYRKRSVMSDGLVYVRDIFMVLDTAGQASYPWDGRQALFTVTLTPESGPALTDTRTVRLVVQDDY
jgi:hypothetical protein